MSSSAVSSLAISAGRPATWLHLKSSSRSAAASIGLPSSSVARSSTRAFASANDCVVPTLQFAPTRANRSRACSASFFQRTSPSCSAVTAKARAIVENPTRASSYPPPLKSDTEATAAATLPFMSLISSASVSAETSADHLKPPAESPRGPAGAAPPATGAARPLDTSTAKSGRSPSSVSKASSKKTDSVALSHAAGGRARRFSVGLPRSTRSGAARPTAAETTRPASSMVMILTQLITMTSTRGRPLLSIIRHWAAGQR